MLDFDTAKWVFCMMATVIQSRIAEVRETLVAS